MDRKRTNPQPRRTAETAGDPGPHIGLKRLTAYRRGALPAAEREALQEHLSACIRCTGLLRELRDFEAAAGGAEEPGPEGLKREAWESLARRLSGLPERPPVVRSIASSGGREARRPRDLAFLAYGAAAAMLLALIGLSVWSEATVRQDRRRLARLEQREVEREEALAAVRRSLAETERRLGAARGRIHDLAEEARGSPAGGGGQAGAGARGQAGGRVEALTAQVAELSAELDELRRTRRASQRRTTRAGQDRGTPVVAARAIEVSTAPRFALRGQERPESGFLAAGGAVNELRVPGPADRVTVALSLADHPVFDEYRLELLDRAGEVLWTARRPAGALLGDAGTSIALYGLEPGPYRLRIEGLRPDGSQLLAEYLLAVELEADRR